MKTVNLGFMHYNGSQLHHAFAYEAKGILGPTICHFIGAADVKDHLVDLEDSLADDFIKSESMAHFIIEIPGADIREAVVWQRLFIRMIAKSLDEFVHTHIYIDGDDIRIENQKLSVSIATLSRFGALIHVGINLCVGSQCPVPAVGLEEFDTFPGLYNEAPEWVRRTAQDFANEYANVIDATYKVIEVK